MGELQAQYRAYLVNNQSSPEIVRLLQMFRKKLFIDRLEWSLVEVDGREVDQFDTPLALHCAVFKRGCLIGGFRAIRGDRPYLAERVFPQFATLRPFPKRTDVYEISRFGIDPDHASIDAAKIMYGVMLRFAREYKAAALVALVDFHHERLLRKFGVKTRRYGPPQTVGHDLSARVLTAVAGEIPMSLQNGDDFRKLLDLASSVEMIDETLVLGRAVVSA